MGKETQVVEIFKCPKCGQPNYIEWPKGQTLRSVACSNDYIEERKPQAMTDKEGNPVIVEQITNKGFSFLCKRGKGDQFVKRVLDHDLGRDTSWQTIETGVADPEGA